MQKRHEVRNLTARVRQRIQEPAPRAYRTPVVQEKAYVDALGGPADKPVPDVPADRVRLEDEHRHVEALVRLLYKRDKGLVRLLARAAQVDPVADGGGRQVVCREDALQSRLFARRVRVVAGKTERPLGDCDTPHLAATKDEIERHADVWQEDHDEEPRERALRRAPLPHHVGDGRSGEQEASDDGDFGE